MARVPLTRFRPELAKWIDHVRDPEAYVLVTSHNREVAALVSPANLRHIWAGQDERRMGPINPATGRPFGRTWVCEHFEGHYERERDPLAALHPSRDEAPWLGKPFPWPPEEPAQEPAAAPEAEATMPPAPPPAPSPAQRRRWWEMWRR